MEEKVFFENGNVKVTNARFVVGNQTHAMNGVTSVSSHVTKPSRTGLIIGLVIGLLVLLGAEGGGKVLGLAIMGICGYLLYNQKDTHAVLLRSASGEIQALSGTDAMYIGGVVSALNDALIHRG
jgi:Family of unknown function (DUF6232)